MGAKKHQNMKNQTVQTVVFDNVAPYPEPVQIAELVNDIEAVIKRHVILKEQAAAALAVWVLHTYTFELRDTVAYVAIESPEKRCGKTTLLSVLAAMAHKPLIASNVTVGALFRAIDTCRPALFIDEADTFLAGNGTMRGIINSSNTWRTAYVLRLSRGRPRTHADRQVGSTGFVEDLAVQNSTGFGDVPLARAGEGDSPLALKRSLGRRDACPTLGESSESGLKRYSCWCPKVIAMIGRVADTIADRSIVVKMSRKLVSESCAPLAELNTNEIRAKCVRFALDAGPAIAQTPKIRGEGLNDRAADTFDPLYVIARLAGNGWEEKLHAAALALTGAAQSESAGSEVLLDVFSVLIEYGGERIFSRDLVGILREGFGGMAMALKYATINEMQIAEMLRPYGIKPATMRIGKEVNRGYVAEEFYEALKRYVPKAEVTARLEELNRRAKLQAEAKAEADAQAEAAAKAEAEAEAERESARMKERLAQHSKCKATRMPGMAALLRRLKQEEGDDFDDEIERL
jgi:hypothetical protein